METWTLNRERQRTLLLELRDLFPDFLPNQEGSGPEKLQRRGDLRYLMDHSLVDRVEIEVHGRMNFLGWKITAKGIDFLADDGGLSAVLGVVTIRLHEDSIKALLIERIEKSNADATVKSELVKQVKALPAEGLKTLTTKALEAGLSVLPNAIQLLHTWLSNQ